MKLTRPTINTIGELIETSIAHVEGTMSACQAVYRDPSPQMIQRHIALLRVRRQWARFVASQEKKK